MVAVAAVKRVALELQGENPAFVSGMEGARGASLRTVQKVLKDSLVSASLMEGVGAVSIQLAPRVLKGALCSARHMVVARGALY